MYTLSLDRNNAEALAFCHQWLAHLRLGDYVAAHAMLAANAHHAWSPEQIERLISNRGSPEPHRSGRRFRITSPETATGVPGTRRLQPDPDDETCTGEVDPVYPFAVYWFRDGPSRRGALGWIHLDYPLDGAWSDLSSLFDIVPCGNALALNLRSIERL